MACILALGLIHTILAVENVTATEASTDSMTSTVTDNITVTTANNSDNAAFGIIHGAHSGYNAWLFLTTISAISIILANQMRVL